MTNNEQVGVTAVVILLGGEEHELSVDQAKVLRHQLNELFGKEEHHTHIYPRPRPPLHPTPETYRRPYDPWRQPLIRWQETTDSGSPPITWSEPFPEYRTSDDAIRTIAYLSVDGTSKS